LKGRKKRWRDFWRDRYCILFLLFLSGIIVLAPLKVFAQEGDYHWIENTEYGWIDWTTYTVYSSINATEAFQRNGETPYCLKVKKLQLLNRLFKEISSIPLKKKVPLGKKWSDDTAEFLWGLINNSPGFSMIHTSENSTTINIRFPLGPRFLKKAIPLASFLRLQQESPPSPDVGSVTREDFLRGFSGIIVQVSTPSFVPAILVYLYDQDGDLLYGPASISYTNFLKNHMALFLAANQPGMIRRRVGDHPLVISATDIFKGDVHSLVLDKNNSFYFRFKGIIPLLQEGRMIIMRKTPISITPTGVQEFNLNN